MTEVKEMPVLARAIRDRNQYSYVMAEISIYRIVHYPYFRNKIPTLIGRLNGEKELQVIL